MSYLISNFEDNSLVYGQGRLRGLKSNTNKFPHLSDSGISAEIEVVGTLFDAFGMPQIWPRLKPEAFPLKLWIWISRTKQ